MFSLTEAAIMDGANSRIRDLSTANNQLAAVNDQLRAELKAARYREQKIRGLLTQQRAHASGLTKQVLALTAALSKVAPSNHLICLNAEKKTWPGGCAKGKVMTNVGAVYLEGFKERAVKLGVNAREFADWMI